MNPAGITKRNSKEFLFSLYINVLYKGKIVKIAPNVIDIGQCNDGVLLWNNEIRIAIFAGVEQRRTVLKRTG